MAMQKARNRKARTAALALYVPTWQERPRTLDELNRLFDQMSTPSIQRPVLRRAFVTGAVVFFVGDVMLFGTATHLLDRDWMFAQYETALVALANQFRTYAQELMSGQSSLEEFRQQMAGEIETASWEAALLVYGPTIWLVPAIAQAVRQLIDRQLSYLDRLLNEIQTGKQKLDGSLLRRVMMYAGGGWAMLYEMVKRMAIAGGYTNEENILGIADHCEGCLEETAKGRVPIGTLVPIGERLCLSNCRCRIRYS